MTDITQGAEPAPGEYNVVSLPDSAGENLSIMKAARALQTVRFKDIKDAVADPAASAEAAAADPTDTESPAQADDGASQEAATPAERTESQAEPAEQLPPIEPP